MLYSVQFLVTSDSAERQERAVITAFGTPCIVVPSMSASATGAESMSSHNTPLLAASSPGMTNIHVSAPLDFSLEDDIVVTAADAILLSD
jgi:hypothetical protein